MILNGNRKCSAKIMTDLFIVTYYIMNVPYAFTCHITKPVVYELCIFHVKLCHVFLFFSNKTKRPKVPSYV